MPNDADQTTAPFEWEPLPEPPEALVELSAMVAKSVHEEAEAQRRAGFSVSEATRRALLLHKDARDHVLRLYMLWHDSLPPRRAFVKGRLP